MNLEGLDISILGPAMLAGMIVLVSHVPLGLRVLQRGIIFIDLAIAQIAGLGVIAASSLLDAESGWWVQGAAFSSALIGAVLLHLAEKHWPERLEAIIGSAFVLAASASLLLLAGNPHGGERLSELLSGQILWVTADSLWPAALISLPLAGVLLLRPGFAQGLKFYALFALAITLSVQLVGVYLVFASLILPALLSKQRLAPAFVIGLMGYGLGLAFSAVLDLPSSPLIVWSMAISGLGISWLIRE